MYPGGKGTCFQQIINLMPPHRNYVEPFLGGGSVFRNKKPARSHNMGVDLDPDVIALFLHDPDYPKRDPWDYQHPSFEFFIKNALDYIADNPLCNNSQTLIYCDPPYLMESRRSHRDMYAHEFGSKAEHRSLLDLLRSLDSMVMISGYWSDLYASVLYDWKYKTFQVMTRGGALADEFVWFNFDEPSALHDYAHLGADFRERERIRRKIRRWKGKLAALRGP